MYIQPAWPTAGTTILVLRFLQAEKQKYVCITGLTNCWHSCPHVTIFTSGKVKTRTYNWLDQLLPQLPPRYNFYDRKSENRYLQLAWHTYSCYPRLMIFTSGKMKTGTCNRHNTAAGRPAASTLNCPHITIFTNGKVQTDTCNRPRVGRKILTTG